MQNSLRKVSGIVCIFLVSLTSCAVLETNDSRKPKAVLSKFASPFGPKPEIISPQQFQHINAAQAQDFLDYFESPDHAQTPGYRRLANYIVQRVKSFEYNADTLTAEQVLQTNSGNCLSLAIMTSALAQIAGITVSYQLMDDDPVFEFNGSTVVKGVHVRTKLLNAEWGSVNDLVSESSGISIDYFPTGRSRFISNLSEQDYYGMYYRNLAVESLQREDFNTAYWLSMESLKFAPEHSDSLNMLAVINKRIGRTEEAEQVYLYAIERAQEKLSLLKNYRVLLLNQGRKEEAAAIALRLLKMDDPSPFNWFHLARESYEEGDYERAISYYRKALEFAPYLHEARLGIALSYYALDRVAQADAALIAAIENSGSNSSRQR